MSLVEQRFADGSAVYSLELHGPFPTKKNKLRPRGTGRGGRGQMYDKDVAEFLERLTLEARGEWGYRAPLVHPDVEIRMYIFNWAKDRDGIWTTVLDALKQARVIWDDSLRWYNGRELKHPAELAANLRMERINVTLRTTAKEGKHAK